MSTPCKHIPEAHHLFRPERRSIVRHPPFRSWPLTVLAVVGWLASAPAASCAPTSSNAADVVPARAIDFHPVITGYGHIAPAAPLWMRARLDATVDRIDVRPGQSVQAGTPLFRLAGPGVDTRLDDAHNAVSSARRQLRLATDSAASARRRYPEFTNRAALDQSLEAKARAEERLRQAQVRLKRLLAWTQVESPIAGRIADVEITPGETLQAGSRVLRIQPSQGLWLQARFFPQAGEKLFVGERGVFHPLSGGPERKVRIAALAPGLTAAGARLAWLAPIETAAGSAWIEEGERGRIGLYGPVRAAVQVPPAALVLDRARWWVVLREGDKLLTRAVEPVPGAADSGVILKGLKPGSPVVVRGSYRLFHRNVASHYTPPD